MNYVDMAFVGLVMLWVLFVLFNAEGRCRTCGAPLSKCNCPSSL